MVSDRQKKNIHKIPSHSVRGLSQHIPYLPKTDSPLLAVFVVQDFLVLSPTTSAGAYVSSAHAGGSVGDVGLRMIWQSFSCSREKNPPFLRGLGHWRADE